MNRIIETLKTIDKKYLIAMVLIFSIWIIYKIATRNKWIFVKPYQRLRDDEAGSGKYLADRDGRKHNGVDILVNKGQLVFMPFDGTVLRIAKPYSDNQNLSGMEIQNTVTGDKVKIFYVLPRVGIEGKKMIKGSLIGKAQSVVESRYPHRKGEMKDHIHIEKWQNGKTVDPTGDVF